MLWNNQKSVGNYKFLAKYFFHDFQIFSIFICNGISIKRTHYKADTSIRRTVWREMDCLALQSNHLKKNLYKPLTLFLHQWCPLYRDSTVKACRWNLIYFSKFTNAFIRKEKKTITQQSMRKSKLRKVGLCFKTGCFKKLSKMIINHFSIDLFVEKISVYFSSLLAA